MPASTNHYLSDAARVAPTTPSRKGGRVSVTKALGSILTLATRVLKATFGKSSWTTWLVLVKAAFGLPLEDDELPTFRRLTGRTRPPAGQVREFWLIVGRRAGKSITAALIAIYMTTCRTYALAPGEVGVFMVIAADRKQARVIKKYISGLLTSVAVLQQLVERETSDAIYLRNGLVIEIHTASFRTVRGYTVIGCALDEIAFWQTDDSANPDTEILNALRPAMSTVPEAMLVALTSPYAKSGEVWKTYRDSYGKDRDDVLVVQAETRALNPLVSPDLIAAAYEADPAHASAEYGGCFRDDIDSPFSEKAVAAVTGDREELPFVSDLAYRAGFDGAGGSEAGGDSVTLAIAHDDEHGHSVLDLVREVKPPFSPEAVILEQFGPLLKEYGIDRVTGDRWGGEWPRQAFGKCDITYLVCPQSKSELYKTLLTRINSNQIELRDLKSLRVQLVGLERRTARGGKDSYDHKPGGHDDVINAAALVLAEATPMIRFGFIETDAADTRTPQQRRADEQAEEAERRREAERAVLDEIEKNGVYFPNAQPFWR